MCRGRSYPATGGRSRMRFPVSFSQQRLWFLDQLCARRADVQHALCDLARGPARHRRAAAGDGCHGRAPRRAADEHRRLRRRARAGRRRHRRGADRAHRAPRGAGRRRAHPAGRVDRGRPRAAAVRSGRRAADPGRADRRWARPAPVRAGHAPHHQRRRDHGDPDRRAVRRLPGRNDRRARVAAATVDGVRRLRRMAARPDARRGA